MPAAMPNCWRRREQARSAGDAMRASLADAATARWAVLRDAPAAQARWGRHFQADSASGKLPAPLAAWVHDFRGLLAHTSRDLGAAAGHYMQSYEAALESGQLRGAITAAINIGDCFASLNDNESALEWMQCALDLARPTGWPRSIGACQTHTAETMRKLGRLAAAEDLLREALHILAPVSGARTYANALFHLGELSLDKGDYDTALDAFSRLAQRAEALGQADFRSMAQRGSAHALSYLDRPDEALQAAERARQLATAQGDAMHQVAALRVLAMLHARHELPPPAGMQERNPALHFLHQALQVASSIEGYVAARRTARCAGARIRACGRLCARLRYRPRCGRGARKKPHPASRATAPPPCRSTTRRNMRARKAIITANWPPPKRAAPKCCSRPATRWNGCRPSARKSPPTSTPAPCSRCSTATCMPCCQSTPSPSTCSMRRARRCAARTAWKRAGPCPTTPFP